MALFDYKARAADGRRVEGSVEARDRQSALLEIERSGHIPVSVARRLQNTKQHTEVRPKFTWRRAGPRMSSREVLVFTTELSDLLASGMTLGNALNALANRKTGRSSDDIVAALRNDILRGASLSEAMAGFPKTFPMLYVSMIRAGEASGALPEVLRRLVEHYDRMQELKESVMMALLYPAIVFFVGILLMIFMMLVVVPQFEKVFQQMGASMPLATKLLIGISRGVGNYGLFILAALIISVILAVRAVKTPSGRFWWDGLLLKTPMIRGIIASSVYASFARTLSTLLTNGVPVLKALGIVKDTVGNTVVGKEIDNARERVTDGTTISGPLAAGKVFPPLMTEMLAVGEQTGDMAGALTHIAQRYENELDRNVKVLTTVLEPVFILVIAIVVGFVALSIMMAVMDLTSGLGV
ncbi:MAG: type II secretion system F family protein [Verrucomicrobiota bacterium]